APRVFRLPPPLPRPLPPNPRRAARHPRVREPSDALVSRPGSAADRPHERAVPGAARAGVVQPPLARTGSAASGPADRRRRPGAAAPTAGRVGGPVGRAPSIPRGQGGIRRTSADEPAGGPLYWGGALGAIHPGRGGPPASE